MSSSLLVFALLGCTSDVEEADPPVIAEPTMEPAVESDPPSISFDSEGDSSLYPPSARDRHRVDIDQLDTLITQATGFAWDGGYWIGNYFDKYAASLGRPDYYESVKEERNPNLLFMKFLSDASKFTCAAMMDHEMEVDATTRLFLKEIDPGETDAQKVSANMRHVLLRFHGRRYSEGDSNLEAWIALFNDGLLIEGDANIVWEGICVALIRHPDFYSL